MKMITDPAPGPGAAAGDSSHSPPPDDQEHLSWMFGEVPASPAPRSGDDVVGRAFDDLWGDWARTGGALTRGEVAALAARRQLSPAQHAAVLDMLEEAGVELPDPAEPRPAWSTDAAHQRPAADSIGYYLRAISRYPLIGAIREVELWSLISQGAAAQQELDRTQTTDPDDAVRRSLQSQVEAGRRAHDELVCANLRLVVSIAKARHYESSGVAFADRIQDGNRGLLRAADKFDGSLGYKFSTYATWWIRQSIDRGIGNSGRTIRIPVHLYETARRIRKVARRLAGRLDREPTLAEIADGTQLDPGAVQAILELTQPIRSIDALLGESGDLHLSDILVAYDERDGRADPADIVTHTMLHRDLTRVLRILLPPRAVSIVARRYGLGTGEEETLESIAADFGITRERVRQIQGRSLKTLRTDIRAASLRAYLVDGEQAPARVEEMAA